MSLLQQKKEILPYEIFLKIQLMSQGSQDIMQAVTNKPNCIENEEN